MKYAIRSLKYFAFLCVLCAAIMLLNQSTGMAKLSLEETFYVMFHSTRGLLLPVVIVVLAAAYPRFGFVTRRIDGNMAENREQILNAFRTSGFSLCSEEAGKMTFRADGALQKLTLLYEDEITVTQEGGQIVVDGIRRAAAKIVYRLDSYIRMTEK